MSRDSSDFPSSDRRLEKSLARTARRARDSVRGLQDLDDRVVLLEYFCRLVEDGTGPLSHSGNNQLIFCDDGLYVASREKPPDPSRFSLPGAVTASISGADQVPAPCALGALHATLVAAGSTDTVLQAVVDGDAVAPALTIPAGEFGASVSGLAVPLMQYESRVQVEVTSAGTGATDLAVLAEYFS